MTFGIPRKRRLAIFALALPLLLSGCWYACGCTSSLPPSPDAAGPGTTQAAPTPVPLPSAETPDVVATPWGAIWAELPAGFPVPQGSIAVPSDAGPVSGSFAVGQSAEQLAGFMQEKLLVAGFRIESLDGPGADGTHTLNAVGEPADCRIQLRIKSLSGTTQLLVLYGAGCPFE